MLRSILKEIQQPETGPLLWSIGLCFGMITSYAIAIIMLGLLPVTTLREVDINSPDAFSIFMAGIIAGVVMAWVVTRNIWSALIDLREEAKPKGSKARQEADATTVLSLLKLDGSTATRRPIWFYWLIGLGIVIALDAAALAAGRGTNLPLGLDRMDGASALSWLIAAILLIGVRPAIEQVIFQGIVYPVVAEMGDDNIFAILVTAVIFALFYLLQVVGGGSGWGVTYWGLIFPFVLEVVAGAARAATKSTYGAIGVHAMVGLFLMLTAVVTYA